LHTSPNGKPLSNEQLKDIAAIKKMLPKQWTFKNIIKLYFEGKFSVEITKKRPINNMVKELEQYNDENNDIIFNIVQDAVTSKISLKSLIIFMNEKASEAWRRLNEFKKVTGTLIPVIDVVYLLNSFTKIAKIITVNIDTLRAV
jgi:hypothetical protein